MAPKRTNYMPLKPTHPKKEKKKIRFQGFPDTGKIFIKASIFDQNAGKYIQCASNFL